MARERRDELFNLLERFFSQPYGKSLVIKGKPGAGKTTLALSFLESIMDHTPVCYLSARFSDSSLLNSFPWLEKASLKSSAQASEAIVNITTDSLKKLERLIEQGKIGSEINNGLILNISDLLPEIRGIYEFVDSNVGRSPLIVIDSIEALSEKYDISSQLLFSVLYADIVERSEGNLIFILEATENPKLEYFADGVISMDYSVIDDFLVRIASIEKLRGISIGSSPKFLYTLSDGRCRAFTKNMIIYPEKKIEVTRGDVTEQFYVPILSSDFHKLTISGESEVSLGSVIMLHRQGNSDDVDAVVNLFKNNLIKDAISMGRGVIDATSSSYETSNVLSNCLDADAMKHYITAEKSKRSNSYVINLEGKSILEDFPNDVIDFFMSSSARPHLYFFSTDFMLFTYGENFFGDLINLLNSIRPTGAVFIITDDNIFNKISHYASLILHFREVNGYTFVNSNKNRSFVAGTRYSRDGWPDITLSEIV